MKITFVISILGLLTAYPLIKNFGVIGGATNIAFAQFLMVGSSFILYKLIVTKTVEEPLSNNTSPQLK